MTIPESHFDLSSTKFMNTGCKIDLGSTFEQSNAGIFPNSSTAHPLKSKSGFIRNADSNVVHSENQIKGNLSKLSCANDKNMEMGSFFKNKNTIFEYPNSKNVNNLAHPEEEIIENPTDQSRKNSFFNFSDGKNIKNVKNQIKGNLSDQIIKESHFKNKNTFFEYPNSKNVKNPAHPEGGNIENLTDNIFPMPFLSKEWSFQCSFSSLYQYDRWSKTYTNTNIGRQSFPS